MERLVYRGGWKANLQHGQGTLFWDVSAEKEGAEPGSAEGVIRFVGRFRRGLLHGRGTEFNERGEKIYVGTFREGKKEGKGVEYTTEWSGLSVGAKPSSGGIGQAVASGEHNSTVIYRGEYASDQRHGFGVAYFPEGHRYLGTDLPWVERCV